MAVVSDLLNNVETAVAIDLGKQAVASLRQYLSRWNVNVSSSQERLETAISEHQREARAWSEEISFKDLLRPKATTEVFVPLDIYLLPRRQHISPKEQFASAPLSSILKNEAVAHIVILGQPGAGKTTAVKHLCQEMLAGSDVFPLQEFPLLIRLRDLNTAKGSSSDLQDLLVERLQSILDIELCFPADLQSDDSVDARRSLRERAVIRVLETLRPLILLDGLDEVSLKVMRDSIVAGVRRLAIQLESARVILTARTGEFSYHIEKMTTYEIAPLSEPQIEQFASGWLGKDDGKQFLSQICNSPLQTLPSNRLH
jgi:predicted NACHT family NTPase